ncbi:hypothetical protein LOAG_15278, partial [Loa loa]
MMSECANYELNRRYQMRIAGMVKRDPALIKKKIEIKSQYANDKPAFAFEQTGDRIAGYLPNENLKNLS